MLVLTKENFWDDLYAKYPGQVQRFCDWIDTYKKANYWQQLFRGENYLGNEVKFHDLPIAMQFGIFQQFCAEQWPSGFGGIESSFEHPKDMEKIPVLITEYFAEMKGNDETERSERKYGQ